MNENHVLSDSSVCSRFTNHSANVNHVQFSEWVAAVPLPGGIIAAELNCTGKGTNQFMKWFRSLCLLKRFACSNDTFATTLLRCCFKLLQLAKHSPRSFSFHAYLKIIHPKKCSESSANHHEAHSLLGYLHISSCQTGNVERFWNLCIQNVKTVEKGAHSNNTNFLFLFVFFPSAWLKLQVVKKAYVTFLFTFLIRVSSSTDQCFRLTRDYVNWCPSAACTRGCRGGNRCWKWEEKAWLSSDMPLCSGFLHAKHTWYVFCFCFFFCFFEKTCLTLSHCFVFTEDTVSRKK